LLEKTLRVVVEIFSRNYMWVDYWYNEE